MKRLAVVAALLAPTALGAQTADVDEERSAWRYERRVTPASSEAGGSFAALVLPPDVAARCQPDLQDARLVDAEGRETPYVIDLAVERAVVPEWSGRLADTRREKKVRSVVVVDLGAARGFDRVALDVREQDFAKRIGIEASDDGQAWRPVRDDAGVFDRPWAEARVHHTVLDLKEPVTARYLRLTADDKRSKPVDVLGVVVSATRRVPGEEWRRPVALQRVASSPTGTSRYRLDLPPAFPFETFELDAEEPAFYRRVRVFETRDVNGRVEEMLLGEAQLYRLRIADEALAGERVAVRVRKPRGGDVILEVQDKDSPPLRQIRGVVAGPATRLLLATPAGPLTFYYGNDATRAPLYDIESLRWSLGVSPSFVVTALGPESENPRFRKPVPIPFAAARGASVDAPRWRAVRRLTIAGHEDLYTFTLAPEDVARLRPDLGDLRIVDEESRQVPYIVEPAAFDGRVDLTATLQERADRSVSRYGLVAPDTAGKPLALPFASVEAQFQEAFFTREARLLVPAPPGARGGERVLFRGMLSRAGASTSPGPAPLVLPLNGATQSELFLEIHEGDNQPLALTQARGVVRVPRLTFKVAPGTYRVLLGNRDALPPRYDIASLRQEVLAYSALGAQAAAAEPNPAFRRFASDYFKDAPPTLLLWGTLVAAVAGLLFLTARILRQPPAAGG